MIIHQKWNPFITILGTIGWKPHHGYLLIRGIDLQSHFAEADSTGGCRFLLEVKRV